jgi:hypothetical protein
MRGTLDELCGNPIGPSTDLCEGLQAGQIEGIFFKLFNKRQEIKDLKNNLEEFAHEFQRVPKSLQNVQGIKTLH